MERGSRRSPMTAELADLAGEDAGKSGTQVCCCEGSPAEREIGHDHRKGDEKARGCAPWTGCAGGTMGGLCVHGGCH